MLYKTHTWIKLDREGEIYMSQTGRVGAGLLIPTVHFCLPLSLSVFFQWLRDTIIKLYPPCLSQLTNQTNRQLYLCIVLNIELVEKCHAKPMHCQMIYFKWKFTCFKLYVSNNVIIISLTLQVWVCSHNYYSLPNIDEIAQLKQ